MQEVAALRVDMAGVQGELRHLHKMILEREERRDKEVDSLMERLNRHRRDLEATHSKARKTQEKIRGLEEEVLTLKVQVGSMADKVCRCSERSPALSGEGTQNAPFELDYEGSSGFYHVPPEETPATSDEPLPVVVREVVEGVLGQDDAIVGRLVPIVEEEEADPSQVEREYAQRMSHTTVRPRRRRTTTLKRQDVYPHRMTAGRERVHPYFFRVESEYRRTLRRGHRGVSAGYQSDSESGSDGLPSFPAVEADDLFPGSLLGPGGAFPALPEDRSTGDGDRTTGGGSGGAVELCVGVPDSVEVGRGGFDHGEVGVGSREES